MASDNPHRPAPSAWRTLPPRQADGTVVITPTSPHAAPPRAPAAGWLARLRMAGVPA